MAVQTNNNIASQDNLDDGCTKNALQNVYRGLDSIEKLKHTNEIYPRIKKELIETTSELRKHPAIASNYCDEYKQNLAKCEYYYTYDNLNSYTYIKNPEERYKAACEYKLKPKEMEEALEGRKYSEMIARCRRPSKSECVGYNEDKYLKYVITPERCKDADNGGASIRDNLQKKILDLRLNRTKALSNLDAAGDPSENQVQETVLRKQKEAAKEILKNLKVLYGDSADVYTPGGIAKALQQFQQDYCETITCDSKTKDHLAEMVKTFVKFSSTVAKELKAEQDGSEQSGNEQCKQDSTTKKPADAQAAKLKAAQDAEVQRQNEAAAEIQKQADEQKAAKLANLIETSKAQKAHFEEELAKLTEAHHDQQQALIDECHAMSGVDCSALEHEAFA